MQSSSSQGEFPSTSRCLTRKTEKIIASSERAQTTPSCSILHAIQSSKALSSGFGKTCSIFSGCALPIQIRNRASALTLFAVSSLSKKPRTGGVALGLLLNSPTNSCRSVVGSENSHAEKHSRWWFSNAVFKRSLRTSAAFNNSCWRTSSAIFS